MSESTRTAVLLDHQLMWLEAVEGVLGRANVQVVGKAADIETALALVTDLEPDLFIADAVGSEEGTGTGFDYLRAAREQVPGVKCIVLAADEDIRRIDAALSAGAMAYVLKSAHPDDLASAVRQAFDQSIYLAHSSVGASAPATTSSAVSAAALTNRERQILQLMAEGHSNAELARKLWVTEQTVKFHLSNVYRKISVSNRTEAARWAQLNGLLPTHDDLPISA